MNSNVEFYETFAADYEQYYAAVDAAATVGQWITLAEAERLVPLAEARRARPPTLLDLGCGPGWHLSPWQTAGFRVSGLDASPAMLRLAAQHGAGVGTEIPLYCADIRDVLSLRPLASEFACIVSHFNFLNLFPPSELEMVFEGVAKLLRNEGNWLTDITSSSTYFANAPIETIGSWQREIMSPTPEAVTVLWRRGNAEVTESYWLHTFDSLKVAAASAGLRWRLSRDWRPADPQKVWSQGEMAPFRQLVIFWKPPTT